MILKNLRQRSTVWLLLALISCVNTALAKDTSGNGKTTQATDNKQSVDLIVYGDYLVSMRPNESVLQNGAVAVKDGEIVDLGSADRINSAYSAAVTLPGKNQIVMPGLINGHTHAAMTLLRGVAEDLALMDWLNNYIFPAEVEFVNAEFVRIGTELACWEMIRGGTTTFVDMYYFPDTVANVVDTCGMRAVVATTVIDQPSPDAKSAADSLANGIKFVDRWKDKNPRITPVFGPHSNYTLNVEQLKSVSRAAEKAGVGISIHMSESPYELEYSKNTYGKTSVEMLDSIGFLEAPVIAAHVVWATPAELPILAQRKVGVIHNPTSNMKIASGVAPVSDMLEAGVLVGLGTDGAASNNDLDMWEEMRLAAFLQKVSQMSPQAMPALSVLNMATHGGARAIGLSDSIGSLEKGKRADIIQVSTEDVHFVPMYDVVSHLIYVADEQDVSNVIVDGKILMRDRQMLTIDTERVKREANALAARIRDALNQRHHSTAKSGK